MRAHLNTDLAHVAQLLAGAVTRRRDVIGARATLPDNAAVCGMPVAGARRTELEGAVMRIQADIIDAAVRRGDLERGDDRVSGDALLLATMIGDRTRSFCTQQVQP